MQRLARNKRGIGTIIATLPLIAIAVAAAVVTYSCVMSMTRNCSNHDPNAQMVDPQANV